MDIKLHELLATINFPTEWYPSLESCSLSRVKVNSKTMKIILDSETQIPVDAYIKLNNYLNDFFNTNCIIEIKVNKKSFDRILEYFNYFTEDDKYKFIKNRLKSNFNNFYVELNNESEKNDVEELVKALNEKLDLVGLHKLDIIVNEFNRTKVNDEIEKDKNVKVDPIIIREEPTSKYPKRRKKIKTDDSPDVILGEIIEGDIREISSIKGEEEDLIVDCLVFGCEGFESAKSDFKIVTLKITDYTESMYAKIFTKDKDEYDKYLELFNSKLWFKIKGYTKYDQYAKNALVLNIQSINLLDKKETSKVEDMATIKRCELHAHTKMSQMDGVADEVQLVKQAIEWGHPGIAITDHDCCQSFPHVFETATKANEEIVKKAKTQVELIKEKIKEKGETKELKEELEKAEDNLKNIEKFKVGYGVELSMCESFLNVCYNPNDDLIKDNTFVVFDTETTGFNAGISDSMIEIGGVKICNGSVIDRFDELINPGHPIDPEITAITEITDEDVADADNEEAVTKKFKEWIGNLPLVAHNARFDKSMLDMAYYKYNLGKLENPIIDTLMLSRVINRDSKKHSLKALGKLYKIDTGDDVDDEEGSRESNTATSIPIDRFAATRIKDVIVDGVSIIKNIDDELYTSRIHKASKTDKVVVKVIYDEDEEHVEEVSLHPADNRITINISSVLSVDISIYVGQHHGADVDSENTALIFNKMLKQVEGLEKLSDFNNLALLEQLSFDNDKSKQEKINELCSYKNYVREVLEDEEVDPKFGYPFIKYGNKNYVWRYEWCHEDNLGMYENIPSKTFTEHLANVHDNYKHVTLIAKTKEGLKNLFKLVSFANSNFLQVNATIPRKLIDEYREGLLVGSACLNGEIFNIALTRSEEDLIEAMKWYDYIEVQPLDNYMHLVRYHDVNSKEDLIKVIEKIIKCAKAAKKIVVATGDVHQINKEDLIYREIIVNQNVPGKGRHPLAKYLAGDDKVSVNLPFIDKVLSDNNRYNDIDRKVLKYIYILTNLESMPITLNTIANIYQVDKNNPSEEVFKDKKQDKSEIIQKSLDKLTNYSIIECNFENYHYCLNDANTKFKKTKVAESGHIPNQYFKTTNEMLEDFSFLDKKLAFEIVVDNPKKIIDSIEEFDVVVYPEKPFSPIIEHSQETCRDLVFEKAHSMYGNPLPRNIEERIAQEFYGDSILGLVKEDIQDKHPKYSDEKIEEIFSEELHKIIMSGYDGVVKLMENHLLKEAKEMDPKAISYKVKKNKEKELIYDSEEAKEQAKAILGGIIGGGFDVIYLIAQKLVKHSNDEGYLVGSRGSVGSSFVATMMGITECNGLPPHYYCPKCQYSMFSDENGVKYTEEYSSGYDLPEKECPKCKTKMIHQGNDMPFATFLGFNADKVPDIDLNFSGENQASAHEYTKVLFGTDNVYRAGTISTVADKTAIGFALGYFEEEEYNKLKIEARSYGIDVPTKDDLKKKGIIKSTHNSIDIERISLGCIDVKRTTGQHPGGIVVVPGYKDVFDFTPFQYPADDPTVAWRTTHFDYHAIDADLLKLDILGHDDPTVLKYLQDMTGVDVTTIDLGDKDTMSIFTGPEILGVKKEDLRGLTRKDGSKYCPTGTLGVPEFGTSFLLGMLEETKPTTFAELIKISGLSHGTDVWLGNARDLCTPDENGNIRVPFKNVIGCRDDIMVNLIQWGMNPSMAFKIMEFVRKGKASKDPVGWSEHVKEMQDANIPDWYIESCEKIKYMFPKAHATAYVTSAFRVAWFKVHMPIYYYAVYFSIRCNQFDVPTMLLGERAIRYRIDELEEKRALRESSNKEDEICDVLYLCLEMTARGFHFENIDITKSDANKFLVTEDKKGLIIPFSALDGLGDSVAQKIIKERKKSPFYSIEDLQARGKVSKTLIDKMKEMHVLDGLPESNQLSLF